jgi:hypothetical protein
MQSGGLDLTESLPLLEKETGRNHFNELLIELNLSLRVLPRPFTTAMIARAIPAAIRPYSIAVAPDWSDRKFNKVRFKPASSGVPYVELLNGSRTTGNGLRLAKSVRANFRYNCL